MMSVILAALLVFSWLTNASAQQSSSPTQAPSSPQTTDKTGSGTTAQPATPTFQQQSATAGASLGPTSPLLGTRSSSARVGNSGAANYSIPIAVPPGTNGVQPNLGFTYNSQSQDNDLLGIHWQLSGLPSIERCPQTVAQDGVKGGVNYDGNDRFCLDGARLILAGGGVYGADNTEYRTEIDSFVKVKAFGAAGNGPSYFKLWTKAGEVMEFGNTADSQIEAAGQASVRVWALNKLQDSSGNYLTISYVEDNANGDYRPSRIDYTGNAAGLSPNRSVQFFYEARSDNYPAYIGGSVIRSLGRLTNVKTYIGATLVKNYQLTYEYGAATMRSRLTSIQECADDACNTSLPGTTLVWQESAQGFTAPAIWVQHGGSYNPDQAHYADVNGDGKADLIFRGTNNIFWVSLSTGNGFTTPTQWMQHGGSYLNGQAQYADVNGDGMADLIFQGSDDSFWVSLSRGTSFTPPQLWVQHGGPFEFGHAQYADVNGDGKADLIMQDWDNQFWVSLSTGTSFLPPDSWGSTADRFRPDRQTTPT